ncbi:MAG: universal stress protein [Pseudomonadales bacterium]
MKRFRKILCIAGQQATSQRAIKRAVALAENNQASVTVAAVSERVPARVRTSDSRPGPADVQALLMENEAQRLNALIEPYRARISISAKVLVGTAFLEIIREVLRGEHDLVVKCSESPDWLGRLFAGDDMNLLRKCPCPVWLVNPGTQEPYRRILAAVDVDDEYPPAELKTREELNGLVMELAGSLAVSEFAELHVVHAWEAFGEDAMRHSAFMKRPDAEVDTYVEQVQRRHAELLDTLVHESGAKLGGQDAIDYIRPQLHLLKGSARRVIPELAKRLEIDCIVMGTVARTGVPGFVMGNTAETILQQIDCSVVAVKPEGFLTPVTLDR